MADIKIFNVIDMEILKIRYCKNPQILTIMFKISKYKNISILIKTYSNDLEQGYLSLGIDFIYRLKNIDHLGFSLITRLFIFEIELECADNRHIEDYKKK